MNFNSISILFPEPEKKEPRRQQRGIQVAAVPAAEAKRQASERHRRWDSGGYPLDGASEINRIPFGSFA